MEAKETSRIEGTALDEEFDVGLKFMGAALIFNPKRAAIALALDVEGNLPVLLTFGFVYAAHWGA